MADIIQLLPDKVANQIAAGEVIQRPASVVKEMLENSIDAGSTQVSLVVKDAGKTLVQVTDNGCGMSETDARMCFERHATSKIRKAKDLFNIRTMGFRGEAMASISAIAHVNLKTKKQGDELGTELMIKGNEVESQEPCQTPGGTTIQVKNLFYNVPARRNFLKSDAVETRHIIDEFQRVALVHPDITFILQNNGNEMFRLEPGNFRQRIVGIFGNKFNKRLVPVEEHTEIVNIKGFVGKPEFSRKTRGEQYFFINNRYIKSGYLNHAVQKAFEELIPEGHYASYFLKLEVDPAEIDINIHPTKTEVKFEDEKAVYSIIRTAVRQALGKYNIAPSLDFDRESSFDLPIEKEKESPVQPSITIDPEYNPFEKESGENLGSKPVQNTPSTDSGSTGMKSGWDELYKSSQPKETGNSGQQVFQSDWDKETSRSEKKPTLQLHNSYILTHIKSGFLIIDQQRAHERILYEQFSETLKNQKHRSQQVLFPEEIEIPPADFELIKDMQEEIKLLGFELELKEGNKILVNGIPAETKDSNTTRIMEGWIEQFKNNDVNLGLQKHENLARSMARNLSVKRGQTLSEDEMKDLTDRLFACEMPYSLPNGNSTIVTFTMEDLDKRFGY